MLDGKAVYRNYIPYLVWSDFLATLYPVHLLFENQYYDLD